MTKHLELHKTGQAGTRNKIQKEFMFVLVVLPGHIKTDRVCEIYKVFHSKLNIAEMILEMPFSDLKLS